MAEGCELIKKEDNILCMSDVLFIVEKAALEKPRCICSFLTLSFNQFNKTFVNIL